MSFAAKTFFAGAIAVSATTVWGVHYLQKWEYDNMYNGILRDDARLAAKAAAALTQSSQPISPAQSSSPVVNQPEPVTDPDCQTCIISPPPQLLEAQSAEQRAKERETRKKEYEDQKALAGRLAREQGGPKREIGIRLV